MPPLTICFVSSYCSGQQHRSVAVKREVFVVEGGDAHLLYDRFVRSQKSMLAAILIFHYELIIIANISM